MRLGFEHANEFGTAMRRVVDAAADVSGPLWSKYLEAHAVRVEEDAELYEGDQLQQANDFLRAALYKFKLSQVSLEQLWALSYDRRDRMITGALEGSLRKFDAEDGETFGIAFGLEQYLLISRTVVDFFKIYICYLLRASHAGAMKSSKFRKALGSLEDPRAEQVLDYFAALEDPERGLDAWLAVLVSLRDRVAHRDWVRPSFTGTEELPTGELFDWPSVKDVTYDRFCQSMDNGIFEMFRELFPVLFGQPWIAGPYRPGMFRSKSPSA